MARKALPKDPSVSLERKACVKEDFVDDSVVTKCMRCRAPFSMTRRKHFCKMCGKVFCAKCTNSRVVLEGLEGLQRICTDCASPTTTVVDGLWRAYIRKMLPVEEQFMWDQFFSPVMRKVDIEAQPMVLLLGQYSVGKTTFIKYLLEQDFPGMRIGPEPTTDRFVALMYNEENGVIPGSALSVKKDTAFHGLDKFGTAFLNKLEAAQCSAPILRDVTLVDTPGVLSGEKQRIGRAYDFPKVVEWFAEKAHMILLLFDQAKLDISDEFKSCISALQGHEDKVRVVLNKADSVTTQQLMRVHGSLMWSLGRVIRAPEAMRVYVGSFWDQELKDTELKQLFQMEEADLLRDLQDLPRYALVRNINQMVKRARTARVHAHILTHLKKQMPRFGKGKRQKQLIDELPDIFQQLSKDLAIHIGDFPPLQKYQEVLADPQMDFTKFPEITPQLLEGIDDILSNDLQKFMQLAVPPSAVEDDDDTALNPFGNLSGWRITAEYKEESDKIFESLKVVGGKITGSTARPFMVQSGLGSDILRKVWTNSDVDKDGKLDADEFALCRFLMDLALADKACPELIEIPDDLIPPSKRQK